MPKNQKPKNEQAQLSNQIPKRALQMANESMLVGPMEDITPILEFLEQFQELQNLQAKHTSKLISIKIPEQLLAAFRFKAQREGVPYQTMIKRLMMDWLRLY
jgi:predicted DNA binding CopG/RHH family protein